MIKLIIKIIIVIILIYLLSFIFKIQNAEDFQSQPEYIESNNGTCPNGYSIIYDLNEAIGRNMCNQAAIRLGLDDSNGIISNSLNNDNYPSGCYSKDESDNKKKFYYNYSVIRSANTPNTLKDRRAICKKIDSPTITTTAISNQNTNITTTVNQTTNALTGNQNSRYISDANKKIVNSRKPYYVKTPASVGSITSIGNDLKLEYVSENPDPLEYYKIKEKSIGSIYQSGNDVQYKEATRCDYNTQYIVKDFVNLDTTSNPKVQAADRICDDLTLCNFENQYISKKKTTTSDIECADLPKCSKTKKLVGNTNFKSGTCQDIGEIIFIIKLNNPENIFLKTKKYKGNIQNFDSLSNIKNYFSNLISTEEKYITANHITSEVIFGIDKDKKKIINDILPCYYKTHNNIVSYLFDLRNEDIKKHFYKKHRYLNISSIEKIYKSINGPLYLFIIGTKIDKEPMKFFNCKNINFSIAYKDQNDLDVDTSTKFIFENVKYDLNMFYEYNKEIALSQISNNNNYLNQFINKVLVSKLIPNYKDNLFNKTSSSLDLYTESYFNGIKYTINQSSQSLIKCNFDAYGDSMFQCKDNCKNEQNCSTIDCNLICENCNNNNCIWTIKQKIDIDLLSPDQITVKGFAGDNLIKLTWIKPSSPSEILKYYIVITSPIDTEFLKIYSLYDIRELCEYIIPDLKNDNPYDIYIFAKNNIGVGKKSNKITIVPNKNNDLKSENNDSYSNSIENYYKSKGIKFDLKKQTSIYEKKSAIQDLKSIIREELKIKISPNSYIVNVF
jgi:hypothetical protein